MSNRSVPCGAVMILVTALMCTGCGGGGDAPAAASSASSSVASSAQSSSSSQSSSVASSSNSASSSSAASSSSSSSAAGALQLTSTAMLDGGTLPIGYTCDGSRLTPPLAWSGAPAGTSFFALLMTTLPGDGTTKWNWVLYDIPAATTRLALSSSGVGTLGAADDGAGNAYAPPCSQGPGPKVYTFTLYALSARPALNANPALNTGSVVTAALAPVTLASARLSVTYTRQTVAPGTAAAINCALLRDSFAAYAATVGVDCSASDYGAVATPGIALHTMMNGITATNLQVPVPQSFTGSNAWHVPLTPAIAATNTSVTDGPVGVAINGVPIFNPCKQGGCQNGDTKVLGELDLCNGHAGRADDYHYHAAPTCLMSDEPAAWWNTHPLGWALDGFAIFGYNNPDGSAPSRDICGGTTLAMPNAPAGYSYHVTDASPYVLACLRGTPSPDLAGQGAKYKPMRQPPVTPFPVSGMTLGTDPADGYQVLQFSSAQNFVTTETGNDAYSNPPGVYRIRYKAVTGAALTALLALAQNAGRTACWEFQFTSGSGAATQPTISYCR